MELLDSGQIEKWTSTSLASPSLHGQSLSLRCATPLAIPIVQDQRDFGWGISRRVQNRWTNMSKNFARLQTSPCTTTKRTVRARVYAGPRPPEEERGGRRLVALYIHH